MADASSLANNIRLSLGPVQVKSIGETGVVSTGSQRREVQLSMDGRSTLLTLWDKETDLEVVAGDMYIVRNIVPSNDFNKQRCYSSTPQTKFEAYECTELQEPLMGGRVRVLYQKQVTGTGYRTEKKWKKNCEIDVKKAKM